MEREIKTLLQSLSSEWAKQKNEKVLENRWNEKIRPLLLSGQESRSLAQWLLKNLWI